MVENPEIQIVDALQPMDEFATKLLIEARSWIGTPFGHQQRLKHVSVDCVNFIDACFESAGVDTEPIPRNYLPKEDGSLMLRLLKTKLLYVPWEYRSPADVIAFSDEALKNKDKPVHIAFVAEVTPATTFIIEAGFRRVARHRLNMHWISRVHSAWRFPRNKLITP